MKSIYCDDDFIIRTCPKEPGASIQISTCGGCQHGGKIDFKLQQVECFYPASTEPGPPDPPEPLQPNQEGIWTLAIKGMPPKVRCPRGTATYNAKDCLPCWHMVRVTWTHVKCAFPKKGVDFGGSRPSAS